MSDEAQPQAGEGAFERHKAELVAQAIEVSRARPELRIVGLVVEADAPEAPLLGATLPPESRDPSRSFAVLFTRELALELLGGSTPGLLDWLEDEGDGPRRRLPVIHAARRGMRTTVIECDVPLIPP